MSDDTLAQVRRYISRPAGRFSGLHRHYLHATHRSSMRACTTAAAPSLTRSPRLGIRTRSPSTSCIKKP
jgi:hypothetical protein